MDDDPPPIAEYAGHVLAGRLDRMLSHVAGVLRCDETESVHQMRVWSRRTRAALDIFESCFEGKEYRLLAREVKAVTGALGAARDLDVMIGTLTQAAEMLPQNQRAGVDAFINRLKEKRKSAQKKVERALAHVEERDLRRQLAEAFAKAGVDIAAVHEAKG